MLTRLPKNVTESVGGTEVVDEIYTRLLLVCSPSPSI